MAHEETTDEDIQELEKSFIQILFDDDDLENEPKEKSSVRHGRFRMPKRLMVDPPRLRKKKQQHSLLFTNAMSVLTQANIQLRRQVADLKYKLEKKDEELKVYKKQNTLTNYGIKMLKKKEGDRTPKIRKCLAAQISETFRHPVIVRKRSKHDDTAAAKRCRIEVMRSPDIQTLTKQGFPRLGFPSTPTTMSPKSPSLLADYVAPVADADSGFESETKSLNEVSLQSRQSVFHFF